MKKTIAAAAVGALLLAPAALADVNGSIQKLTGDASSWHAALVADGQKVVADLAAAKTATDQNAAKAALMTDLQKLRADLAAAHAALQADRQARKATLETTTRDAAGGKTPFEQLRQTARAVAASLGQERHDALASAQALRQAFASLRPKLGH
jgi:hypothetical protein